MTDRRRPVDAVRTVGVILAHAVAVERYALRLMGTGPSRQKGRNGVPIPRSAPTMNAGEVSSLVQ